ncbi:MAG: cyclic beta 1-2 glucan synthetase, partial [Planctomycetaceae bacterium]|nr:cyclic beta 1-2 glucan synthetase [Planctomycetaceae bacterium]
TADGRDDGAGRPATTAVAEIRRHVGYFLVDEGLGELERLVNYRPERREVLRRAAARAPLTCYLLVIASIWLLTVLLTGVAGWKLGIVRNAGMAGAAILLALFGGAATQFAVSVTNWLCTLLVSPKPIVRLDFSRGIPPEARTLVAVPAMLSSADEVRSLVDQLELRYLGNRDRNLLFALVTDFPDATSETLPGDRRLVTLARNEIERLNRRYRRDGETVFYLLHRSRQWNPQQGTWMGQERKRGKLAALNQLLLAGRSEAFSTVVGDLQCLKGIRYLITLDADTRLPPQTARQLVGCMAHPLNWPTIDPATQMVVRGYAVLQPRTGATITESRRSFFAWLAAGDAGLDPYTRETSDVYQDLFHRGSFIGKGIYDVEAFERVTRNRFPANRILSHDLIEGCVAGSGLVSDVELFESVPSRLLADLRRRHRWIRGDWQIASWLRRRVPSPNGPIANPLDALSRWKIFDNLRRSVSPPLLFACLVAGWLLATDMAVWWALLVAALVFGPTVLGVVPGLVRKPDDTTWRLHIEDRGRTLLGALAAEAVGWCVLPHVAYSNIDAIVRTLYRLRVSHRNLLEWTTASDGEAKAVASCLGHYAIMWPCLAGGTAVGIAMAMSGAAVSVAGLIAAAWMFGPALAWWISRPRRASFVPLSARESQQYRRWARQTWHYFETSAERRHHWLTPDNIQETPRRMVAHRTSPTNIGMALVADLAACDLGYLSRASLLERAMRTFDAAGQLERYRGHLFNWYDTRTLEPAMPRYVSSVDSGNFWAALTVFHAGLAELPDQPLVHPRLLDGLSDTVEVIVGLRAPPNRLAPSRPFDRCLARLRTECSRPMGGGARRACRRLCRIRTLAASLAAAAKHEAQPLRQWAQSLVHQSAAAHRDIARLAFWTHFPKTTGRKSVVPMTQGQPTSAAAAGHGGGATPSAASASIVKEHGVAARLVLSDRAPAASNGDCAAYRQLRRRWRRLDRHCSLRQLIAEARHAATQLADLERGFPISNGHVLAEKSNPEFAAMRRAAMQAASAGSKQLREICILKENCRQFGRMDFRFLYHPQRKLLAIGFDADRKRREDSYYGLLASEARLTSFLAVSHGQLPLEHWFALGRMATIADARPVLLSWSGSMFEHLMPALLMPSPSAALLDTSGRRAVRRQIRYARRCSIPWGISESCHHQMNEDMAYRYRMFGVPGLGLMRGLAEHLVVAPYASALASMVAPRRAARNLERLEQLGCLGPSGFYDAIDYTDSRKDASSPPKPCRTVMVHHSGMALLAFTNVLLGWPMWRRFSRTRLHAAYEVLLQERWPHAIRPFQPQ